MTRRFGQPVHLIFTLSIAVLASCSSDQSLKPTRIEVPVITDETKPDEQLPLQQTKAPWEVSDVVDEELTNLLKESKVREALILLSERKKTSPNEQTFTDLASLLLKLGRPKESLSTVSEFVNLNQLDTESIPGQLTLIAAYAYKSQKDIDQTFAWFGVALRSSSPEVSVVANSEVKNLLSRISDSIFNEYFIKWEKDQSLSPLILEEQIRRRNGGAVVRLEEPDYFSPTFYGYSVKEIPKVVTQVMGENAADIVLLVPTKGTKTTDDQKKAVGLALSGSIPALGFQEINSLSVQIPTPPKIVINLASKPLPPNELTKGALVLSVNPRLVEGDTSIAAKLSDEVAELIKITKDSQCDETFAVTEESISIPPTIRRVSIDELLSIASKEAGILAPCLIGGFEVEDQIEKLNTIKSSWPGLRLFGRSSWVDPVLLQTYQGLFEGSVFITPFYLGSSREVVREFLSSFQNTVGKEGTYGAALAYDAGRISALILGNKQPQTASYNLQSVTGIESFVVNIDRASGSKKVAVSERRFTRLTLKGGDLEELSGY